MPAPKPAAETAVDVDVLRRLLSDQRPDLVDEPLRVLASGWDNVSIRIGATRLARLPRRSSAADLVANEARWLPELAPRLPLPIPVPEFVGDPDGGYPFPWTIVPFVPGDTAAQSAPRDLRSAGDALAEFIVALARPAPPDAPVNPYRGIPLADRRERTARDLAVLAGVIDVAVHRIWDDALAAPAHDGAPVWLHGDLHPHNLVVHGGRLVSVIDFGDICGGDPATDLAAGFMLLPAELHDRFRSRAGAVDAACWRRARGWAAAHAVACLANSADDAVIRSVGQRTLDHVLASDA